MLRVEIDEIQELRDQAYFKKDEYDVFAVLASEAVERCPIAKIVLKPEETKEAKQENRRVLVKAYEASVKVLASLYQEIECLRQHIAVQYAFTTRDEIGKRHETHAICRSSMSPLKVADALFAGLMIHETDVIRKALLGATDQTAKWIFESFRLALEAQRTARIVGTIEWASTDVCTYDFHRAWWSKVVSRRYKKEVEVSRTYSNNGQLNVTKRTDDMIEYETREKSENHEHQLFNSVRYQYPAANLRKPKFVQNLLATIPAWLQPHIFIVEGDMLRETIRKHERVVESEHVLEKTGVETTEVFPAFQYSPAVTLGDFVLTGWSGKDL